MKRFVKPSGMEVMVNANSEQAAIAMGWKPVDAPKEQESIVETPVSAEAPKRRGRPSKVS